MPEQTFSAEVLSAFDALRQSNLVEVSGPLETDRAGNAVFRFDIDVPQPNAEGVPRRVTLEGRIGPGYPFGKIVFVPVDQSLDGFPHQSSRRLGGELCLLLSQGANGWDPTTRLQAYVRAAVVWVQEAAQGLLLEPGQPWELPDFRTGNKRPSVLYSESHDSLSTWEPRIGQTGQAVLSRHTNGKHIVVTRLEREGEALFQAELSPTFTRPESTVGQWLLLPGIVYTRHRAPRTFSELAELCERSSIDLWAAIRRGTKKGGLDDHGFVLVGFPIPEVVGGPPREIHWQAIAIPQKLVAGALRSKSSQEKDPDQAARSRLEGVLKGQDIPWADAVNVGGTRLEARGVLSSEARNSRICLLGCGAIGSVVAEQLARGGVRDLAVFDDEQLEFENLTRHTLAPGDVGKEKTVALANRLNGLHPRARITPFPVRLPLTANHPLTTAAFAKLLEADVVIDCTTHAGVFRWASALGRRGGQRVFHMFTNARARALTICCSGAHASCHRVASLLFEDIRAGRAPISVEEYDASEETIEPGAGCWKATFPATGHDISALVSCAVPVMEAMITSPRKSRGTAVVMRRNDVALPLAPQPLVELLMVREYR